MNRNYLILCLFGILSFFNCANAIMGGIEVQNQPMPYMVSLLEEDFGHLCGGALIGQEFVLSAAHCFVFSDNTFKYKRIYALMGTNDLMKMTEPAINIAVFKVFIPTDFNAASINSTGDIAVVRLIRPVQIWLFEHLKIGFLENNRHKNYTGEHATIAGWGWNVINYHGDHPSGHRTDSLLRHSKAVIFSHQQCQSEHPTLKITEEHLCAKVEQHPYEIRGVCYGDDGGPLVHHGYIIGVLSKFSIDCSERTKPAVYTRISHYLTFVRNSKNDYETKFMRVHTLPI